MSKELKHERKRTAVRWQAVATLTLPASSNLGTRVWASEWSDKADEKFLLVRAVKDAVNSWLSQYERLTGVDLRSESVVTIAWRKQLTRTEVSVVEEPPHATVIPQVDEYGNDRWREAS